MISPTNIGAAGTDAWVEVDHALNGHIIPVKDTAAPQAVVGTGHVAAAAQALRRQLHILVLLPHF